jgi:prepilin-type N-terminal cleavage/methylation domain-containing protein
MGKSDMRRIRGFSLVELMIVIAILAVMSAIAVFSWARFTANSNLRAATADMEADLMLMKEKARSDTANSYSITFNLAANNYTMTGTGSKTPASFAPDIKITSVDGINSGSTTITFQKRGILSPGSIVLSNKRASKATITYNITGRTYVTYAMQ